MQTTYFAPSLRPALTGMMIERKTRAGRMLLALKLLENESDNEEALRKGRKYPPHDLVDMGQCAILIAHATGRIPEGDGRYLPDPERSKLIPPAWISDAQICDFTGWRSATGV